MVYISHHLRLTALIPTTTYETCNIILLLEAFLYSSVLYMQVFRNVVCFDRFSAWLVIRLWNMCMSLGFVLSLFNRGDRLPGIYFGAFMSDWSELD